MIVMKFGGTSVGTGQRMHQVIDLVSQAKATPVVVTSAMSGITNALIDGAQKAVNRDLNGALAQLEFISKKHLDTVHDLFGESDLAAALNQEIEARMEELGILYKGISYLGELTKRSLDAVSGLGELLSSKMLAALAHSRGLKCQWLDARQFIITDEKYGRANPLWEELLPKTRETISPCVQKGEIVVTQGFIGSTSSGASTTLGRGGSDYSASIIGVALDAQEIQIWTDVDGMMTADPRVVTDARVLPQVSFQEASELAYFGAKVLHPLTIKPAVEKQIPVRILNTLRPEQPGTLISSQEQPGGKVRAVAAKKDITAIFITSPQMLMAHGFLAKVFAIFDKHQVPIDLISTSEVSISLTIDQNDCLAELTEELQEYGEVTVIPHVAVVTVVGQQFREQSGIAGLVFDALRDINILMISGGASEINLSFVVYGQHADNAVRQLHHNFFNSISTIHSPVPDSLGNMSRLNAVVS